MDGRSNQPRFVAETYLSERVACKKRIRPLQRHETAERCRKDGFREDGGGGEDKGMILDTAAASRNHNGLDDRSGLYVSYRTVAANHG